MRIFVTGIGIISALGNNAQQNRSSLSSGKSGISSLEMLSSRYASIMPFGEVKISTDDLIKKMDARESGVTRTDLLALHAFNEAVNNSRLTPAQLSDPNTALIGASTVGGMCLTDELFLDSTSREVGSPYLSSYDCASPVMYLQKRFSIGGVINSINTACSSSANAIMYGARLIKQGKAKRAIVGGTDSLAKFTINGFNSLLILSDAPCQPFDEARRGLNLGEGAAFLVLEAEEDVKDKNCYAELTGYSNTNDAFHPSSLSDNGDGPFLSMQGALRTAGLETSQIDFINAHGTGTENNDLVESRAMINLFTTPPPFVSTKAYTGHTLGAAGAIEAVFSIFSLVNDEIYPAVNFEHAIADTGLVPAKKFEKKRISHVMSNSFGFGGNCTSLILSKV
ncbi:MAG: beta-ketoacyl-[acyl-carrier-protein] synthase family protein [Gemmatimonadaceae bacterium]|nr:beta-ketoacyl-[acyl-carrier-protein] synthase family protein [Chitinophagaceae bacterium]